ncbi:hypothetical protein CYMTET_29729 [Cymbomonas tetramitiformis]|uniref:ABC transporter domain-containing protein n=1 Tax=Cymbomonas tetramitiformis TaxID=36881 RepID=A0AAE0FKG6_9CHLO|nr:hypothetical protein CYMTET_29729 [Cymbomonas tetramitiformis]
MKHTVNTLILLTAIAIQERHSQFAVAQTLYEECYNALDNDKPHCYNNGTLHTHYGNTKDPVNCATCDCPKEWKGADCKLCASVNSCPTRNGSEAIDCSSNTLLPTLLELNQTEGKLYRCTCGLPTDIYSTNLVCSQLPMANYHVSVTYDPDYPQDSPDCLKKLVTKIVSYAGIPSQAKLPKTHYKTAYPEVWEGTWKGCQWVQDDCGKCPSPYPNACPWTTDDLCYTMRCSDTGTVYCPPPYVTKCPGWTSDSCGPSPDSSSTGKVLNWWQHHCNEMVTPVADNLKLMCLAKPNATGHFFCWFSQEGSSTVGVGMVCEVGNCLYNQTQTPEPPEDTSSGSQPLWAFATMGGCALVLVGLAGAVALYLKGNFIFVESGDTKPAGSVADSTSEPLLETSPQETSFREWREAKASVTLSWRGVALKIRTFQGTFKFILHDVSGVAGASEDASAAAHVTGLEAGGHSRGRAGSAGVNGLMAIMGPSGAGKSTLLDLLAGRRVEGDLFGEVCLDGRVSSPNTRRQVIGYVLQEVVLPGTSTVREYLMFNASLRLSGSRSRQQIASGEWKRVQHACVSQMIGLLGLSKVASSIIGDDFIRGLSGGEKRRVSIGAELIESPSILLLDEPTTGLDSPNASKVVRLLADLARSGVNVVTTIHQPRLDMFLMMERVLLLSGRGEMVYEGLTRGMESYFRDLGYEVPPASDGRSAIHIADYMLDTVIKSSQDSVTGLVNSYHTSQLALEEDTMFCALEVLSPLEASKLRVQAGFGFQLYALSGRQLLKLVRHPFLVLLQYGVMLATAIILGALFYQSGTDTEQRLSRVLIGPRWAEQRLSRVLTGPRWAEQK